TRIVDELIALAHGHAEGARLWPAAGRLPGLATVARPLDDLPEPAARLRGVNPVRIGRRALHVVDLPAGEERPADLPLRPVAVRRENKGALLGADENADAAHVVCSLSSS